MDKPIIAYDRFDGGRRQVHRSDDPVHLAAAAVESVIGNDRFIHVQRSCFRV